MLLPNRLSLVIIYVSDMERSVAFYRDTLELPLRFQSPDWTEFALETVTLALHGGGTPSDPGSHGDHPRAGAVQTGWSVPDLDAVHQALTAKGVRFVMPPTDLPQEGIRLAVFLDPDGCPLSLSQPFKR